MPSRDDDGSPSGSAADDRPEPGSPNVDDRPSLRERARWLLGTDQPAVSFVRELVSSVLLVLLVGALLFAASGVWPPMVAVESGSMEPHMSRGDLVFVMEETRLSPSFAEAGTGVVSYRAGQDHGYDKFGMAGDVIVFRPNGADSTPIIHRARFWVNDSENWYDKADPDMVSGGSCSAIPNCPAPHAGFITKGDNNRNYDQVGSVISAPVRPEWIRGTAEVRVPYLGYVRLQFATL